MKLPGHEIHVRLQKYFDPIMYRNNALKKNDAAWNNIYYNIAIVLLSLLLLHK